MADVHEIIWRGCNPAISAAVQRVAESWGGYSTDLNAKRSIVSLIKKFIDPAVDKFKKELPNLLKNEFLKGQNTKYSDFILKYGYDESRKYLQNFERNFAANVHKIDSHAELSATFSTIYSFTWECELRRARHSPIRDKDGHEGGLNRSLDLTYCVICGNATAFAASLARDHPRGEGDIIRPSYKFCPEHTPLLNGKCNSVHKKGMRQLESITREFYRLLRQSNLPGHMPFTGNITAIDWYFFSYVEKHDLRGKYFPIIRRHAYEIVRDGISDRKKEIQALRSFGRSQCEIAAHIGVERQSISKALNSTPPQFRI